MRFNFLGKIPHPQPLPEKRGGEREELRSFCPREGKNSSNLWIMPPSPREGGQGMGPTTKLKRTPGVGGMCNLCGVL